MAATNTNLKADPIPLLVAMLDQSVGGRAWHGPNLHDAIAGLGAQKALQKAVPDRPDLWCIWQIVLHVALCMHQARFQIAGQRPVAFPIPVNDEDTPSLPRKPGPRQWARAVRLLDRSYRMLRQRIAETPASELTTRSSSRAYGRRWTRADHIYGIAMHNAYHAAQIKTIRKLRRA